MYREINVNGTPYLVQFGLNLTASRVTIKDGAAWVSHDITGRTPAADFEALFYTDIIDVVTAPVLEDGITHGNYKIGPLVSEDGDALDSVRIKKKEELRVAWENEVNKNGMPVLGETFRVNFDILDSLIWSHGLAMSQEDPVMVRGIDNQMYNLTRAKALEIPELQRQYYAEQIKKKWELQNAVDTAQTVADVEAITWE